MNRSAKQSYVRLSERLHPGGHRHGQERAAVRGVRARAAVQVEDKWLNLLVRKDAREVLRADGARPVTPTKAKSASSSTKLWGGRFADPMAAIVEAVHVVDRRRRAPRRSTTSRLDRARPHARPPEHHLEVRRREDHPRPRGDPRRVGARRVHARARARRRPHERRDAPGREDRRRRRPPPHRALPQRPGRHRLPPLRRSTPCAARSRLAHRLQSALLDLAEAHNATRSCPATRTCSARSPSSSRTTCSPTSRCSTATRSASSSRTT